MITVILVRPEHPGNIGAIARVMANFSLENLVLVNPTCDHLCVEARNRAKHAQKVLDKAKVVKRIPSMQYLVATTAQAGGRLNPRSPLTPKQLVQNLPRHANVGILFGPEGTGLSNPEIMAADFAVTIPASPSYPVLNLSQAATIILYELFDAPSTHMELATEKDRDLLLRLISGLTSKMHFTRASMNRTQKIIWKRVLGKSFLTKREFFAMIGFFKKLKVK